MAIVTTRAVKNKQIVKTRQPLKHVTTKDVEVKYIDEPVDKSDDGSPIFKGPKHEPVTTHDFEDVAEKDKRAQIMAEKKALFVWPEDILIGTFEDDETVGLFNPDWKKEPIKGRKR